MSHKLDKKALSELTLTLFHCHPAYSVLTLYHSQCSVDPVSHFSLRCWPHTPPWWQTRSPRPRLPRCSSSDAWWSSSALLSSPTEAVHYVLNNLLIVNLFPDNKSFEEDFLETFSWVTHWDIQRVFTEVCQPCYSDSCIYCRKDAPTIESTAQAGDKVKKQVDTDVRHGTFNLNKTQLSGSVSKIKL